MKFLGSYFARFKSALLLGGVKSHAQNLKGLAKEISKKIIDFELSRSKNE